VVIGECPRDPHAVGKHIAIVECYHRQAERVRKLAQNATTPAIRDQLADVAREYEHLAEEAEAGYRALR